MERITRLELATSTLARWRSTRWAKSASTGHTIPHSNRFVKHKFQNEEKYFGWEKSFFWRKLVESSPKEGAQKRKLEILHKIKKNRFFLLHFVSMSGIIGGSTKEGGVQMAKCEICGKGVTFGIKLSHSHRRTNRTWKPNIRRVKVVENGTPSHKYVCTRCLRSNKVTRG